MATRTCSPRDDCARSARIASTWTRRLEGIALRLAPRRASLREPRRWYGRCDFAGRDDRFPHGSDPLGARDRERSNEDAFARAHSQRRDAFRRSRRRALTLGTREADDMTTVFHVSDLHFGWPAVPEQIDAIEQIIQESKFDVVAISGDLTQRARSGEFQRAAAFIRDARKVSRVIAVPG